MIVKNSTQLSKIKTSAKINRECLFFLKELTEPGISSYEVNIKAEEFYSKHRVKPAFKGYMGYPATINFMINDGVVHCIPKKDITVKEGDLVSIDTGCIYKGFYSDQAISFGVGKIKPEDEKLLNIAEMSIEAGCNQCIAGNTVGDIGNAQQTVIEMAGFNVVRQFVGHEIGKKLHDPMKIPPFGKPGQGPRLKENLLLAIENQVCVGSNRVYTDKEDNWSTYTKDGKDCVTFEHMVIVKNNDPYIITKG
ncbi:type I methionyl aminopeptidase [Candidatus Dojkabacteria bacterium]|nr:type I methionyl aminopeptidase [Candidatus Dojkabacteria bacterium]